MPCWTVRQVSIDLKAADGDILLAGMRAAGFTVNQQGNRLYGTNSQGIAFEIINGQVKVNVGDEAIANEINRSYSAQVRDRLAKKLNLRQTVDSRNKNKVYLRSNRS